MSTLAPPRSREQRLAALAYANRIRVQRAELKRVLRSEPWIALHAIQEPAPWLDSMKLVELLAAVPRAGWARVQIWLDRSRISHSKTLGGLTQRQRDALTLHVKKHIDRLVA